MDGLTYIPDFIDSESAEKLLSFVDGLEWSTKLNRRTQQYGWMYNHKKRELVTGDELPMPEGFSWVRELLTPYFGVIPDQIIVNEYQPGQGISAHIDCQPCFGDVIASITLNSGCEIRFTRSGFDMHPLYLEPNSLMLMQGEARHLWKHGIPRQIKDRNGVVRGRRVSLTFRTALQ